MRLGSWGRWTEYKGTLQIGSSKFVLTIVNEHYRLLFKAHFSLRNYEEAISFLKQLLTIDPKNTAAIKLLESCKGKQKSQREKEKKLYSNMFQKLAQDQE